MTLEYRLKRVCTLGLLIRIFWHNSIFIFTHHLIILLKYLIDFSEWNLTWKVISSMLWDKIKTRMMIDAKFICKYISVIGNSFLQCTKIFSLGIFCVPIAWPGWWSGLPTCLYLSCRKLRVKRRKIISLSILCVCLFLWVACDDTLNRRNWIWI